MAIPVRADQDFGGVGRISSLLDPASAQDAATKIYADRISTLYRPNEAEFPSSNFPQLSTSNRRPILWFDASTSESAYWTDIAPQGSWTTLTCVVTYCMASATSGNIILRVAIEAITAGDSTDTDATTSFDSANSSATTAVPGTAGYIGQVSVTLTNKDSIAAADYFRLSLDRDAANGSDTASGDLGVLAVELRWS